MPNRLTKIYTRKGDQGATSLGNGERVEKVSKRISVLGDFDELNCLIGIILSDELDEVTTKILIDIQHVLFDVGGEVSVPGKIFITSKYVTFIEEMIDRLNLKLGNLKEFILPGGGRSASTCHYARAVCRRSERELIHLSKQEAINEQTLKLLNRLSDLLFVLARTLAKNENKIEQMWNKKHWREK